jgi:transcriptional regulator with PAS, ATPase and Fis domain
MLHRMMTPGSAASTEKQAQQLKLLIELSTKLQSLLESENLYPEILNLIQTRFSYYSIHFWSVGSDSSAAKGSASEARCAASKGSASEARCATLRAQAGAYLNYLKTGHVIRTGEGITGHVIRTKKSYLCNDVSKDPNFTNLSIPVHTRSELCVPIVKDGEVLATINVESDQPDAFDENDVITLEAVASQVAVTLTNQRLYSETKAFNFKLQATVEEKTLELRKAHERILEQQKLLQKENKALKTLVDMSPGTKVMDIVGRSPAILSTIAMVDKIAPTTATVLIQGESGTGKELIARRLHHRSERANKPYVTVNCGALQESLLESELFGHEKGSFTGAVVQKMGLCETADGGTLFLDEIGEMSPQIQTKLLRFLQEGEFYRIGGKRPIKVDVRVVSATNKDLEIEVKAQRFREDLFYRLNTITLRMPPLRKRAEDIPMLVEFFLKNSRFGGAAQQIRKIDPRVIEAFQNYDWPGNIRELQNTIERLKILAENNEIRLEDIPFGIRMPKAHKGGADSGDFAVEMSLDDVEKSHILRTLAFNQNNKTKTAHSLGITIKTLYNKLHRYGILPPTQPSGASAPAASAHEAIGPSF